MTTLHQQPYYKRESGIALFIAIIFASVVLLIGLTMASFGYKQAILSSSAVASQKAYYAADSALECVLYADQQISTPNIFKNGNNGTFSCAGTIKFSGTNKFPKYYKYTIKNIKNINPNVCADAVIYKTIKAPYETYIFSTGYYNVSKSGCTINTNTTVQGISINYGS